MPVEVGESWHGADGFMVRPVRALTIKGAQIAGQNRVRDGSATTAAGTKRAAHLAALAGRPRRARSRAGSAAPESSSGAPLSPLPGQVAGVVSTVEKVAVEVPAALPLQAPSLPPVPVDVPKVPGGTPLP